MVTTLNEQSAEVWKAFLLALGMSTEPDKVADALIPLVGTALNDAAIELLQNTEDTPTGRLHELLAPIVPTEGFRNKAIRNIRAKAEQKPKAADDTNTDASTNKTAAMPVDIMSLLIQAPSDDDMLKALTTTERPVFEPANIASVIRAAVARRLGVYDLPKTLAEAIRASSRAHHIPNPPIFRVVNREARRRTSVGAIVDDMVSEDQPKSLYVDQADIDRAFKAMDKIWPVLIDFQVRLRGFRNEAYVASLNMTAQSRIGTPAPDLFGINPLDLVGIKLDPKPIVDQVENLVFDLNEIFEDQGLDASRILGERAARFTRILELEGLPAAVGTLDHKAMMSKLDIRITQAMLTDQAKLITWLINVVRLGEIDASRLPAMLVYLAKIGDEIPWNSISGGFANLPPAQVFSPFGNPQMMQHPIADATGPEGVRDGGGMGRGGTRGGGAQGGGGDTDRWYSHLKTKLPVFGTMQP